MESTRWVQHVSGQGEKFELKADRLHEGVAWMAKIAGTPDNNCMSWYLPKSEYVLCDPPEVWRDVTAECTFDDEHRLLPRNVGSDTVVNVGQIQRNYRLRKVPVFKTGSTSWAFIVEHKQP